MKVQTIVALSILLLLALLSRTAGVFINDNAKDGYVFTNNMDETTFTKMITRYNRGLEPANTNYPPGFPTTFLSLYKLSKPFIDNWKSAPPFIKNKRFFPRLVSSTASIFTALVLFLLTLSVSDSILAGCVASLFYILSPGGLIHACYGTADSFHTCMFWLSTYLTHEATKYRNLKITACAVIVTGFSIGVKWTVSLLPQIVSLAIAMRQRIRWYYFVPGAVILLALGLFLSYGSDSSLATLMKSAGMVSSDNILVKDHNYLLNPVGYLLQLIVGVALPCFLFGVYGVYSMARKSNEICKEVKYRFFAIIVLNCVAHLLLISTLAIPTTRHTMPLIPFFALTAGIGVWSLIGNWSNGTTPLLRRSVLAGILFVTWSYQVIAAVSFIRPYIETNNSGLFYGWFYAEKQKKNVTAYEIPWEVWKQDYDSEEILQNARSADYIFTRSEAPMKYLQSQINPWGVPDCAGKLYHGKEAVCRLTQRVFLNPEEFQLHRVFTNYNYVPEQMLFHYFWGTYDHLQVKYYVFVNATDR